MADSTQTNWNAVKSVSIHVFSTGLRAWIGDPKIYLTILAVSTQTNIQRLRRRENNG
jgi:hypothetical protein